MLYKVWSEICKVPDVHLRLFLALCTDQQLLSKTALGFPEFFTDNKPERDGPIPLSALKEIAAGLDQDTLLNDVSGEYGLPSFNYAHPDSGQMGVGAIPMPKEIVSEYVHYSTRYNETGGFPFNLDKVNLNGMDYYVGWVNSTGVQVDHEKDFYVFPCDLVDVNA
jgi:hypothetical protein